MNITIIAGNVGKQPELRHTQGGDAILSFPLAVGNGKDKQGNKRDATWFDCSIWGKRATALEGYISKGSKLTITGRVSAREHDGKAYLQLSVNDLTFQGSSGGSGYDRTGGKQDANAGNIPAEEGEIPF